ncbi:MAG: ferritin-like domain-containing protein [Candidatus Brocadiae bacterium]|nr:ferritin-like domain-containing protein [Candidatus Brocadiia bacterium]
MKRTVTKAKLIEHLDADLSRELKAILLYMWCHSMAFGIRGHELREILAPEIHDEIKHVQFLADKIIALGGTPRFVVPEFKRPTAIREMLEYALSIEREAVQAYAERVDEASDLGETALQVKLEELITEETEHLELLQRLVKGLSPEQ